MPASYARCWSGASFAQQTSQSICSRSGIWRNTKEESQAVGTGTLALNDKRCRIIAHPSRAEESKSLSIVEDLQVAVEGDRVSSSMRSQCNCGLVAMEGALKPSRCKYRKEGTREDTIPCSRCMQSPARCCHSLTHHLRPLPARPQTCSCQTPREAPGVRRGQ